MRVATQELEGVIVSLVFKITTDSRRVSIFKHKADMWGFIRFRTCMWVAYA